MSCRQQETDNEDSPEVKRQKIILENECEELVSDNR